MTTTSEDTAAELAAESQRKADIVAQNVLPVWHTNSTVTGERTRGLKEHEQQITNAGPAALPKAEEDEKKDGEVLNDELASYYAQMQQEKEKEAREDQEADESSGEDDDDDFEDVGIGASVAVSSSSSTVNGTKAARSTAAGKKRGSESGSSAPGTNISTPAGSILVLDDEDAPAAKRVKPSSQGNENGGAAKPHGSNGAERDSDEDDEAEFEDAL